MPVIRPVSNNPDELRLLKEYNDTIFENNEDARAFLAGILGDIHPTAVVRQPFRCDDGRNIRIGAHSFINYDCLLMAYEPITIMDRVLIGPRSILCTAAHPKDPTLRAETARTAAPITIENDVWLGANVTVLPGVTIHEGAIVGAGAVVTKDVPAHTTVAGVPARPI